MSANSASTLSFSLNKLRSRYLFRTLVFVPARLVRTVRVSFFPKSSSSLEECQKATRSHIRYPIPKHGRLYRIL